VMLVACGGDDGSTASMSCETMAHRVTQQHGACRIDADPNSGFGDGCWFVQGAWCAPDGVNLSCPNDWAQSCSSHGCYYSSNTACTGGNGSATVTYDFFQTLDGVNGLAVYNIADAGSCKFLPCL
jgi:hypothetical protein